LGAATVPIILLSCSSLPYFVDFDHESRDITGTAELLTNTCLKEQQKWQRTDEVWLRYNQQNLGAATAPLLLQSCSSLALVFAFNYESKQYQKCTGTAELLTSTCLKQSQKWQRTDEVWLRYN